MPDFTSIPLVQENFSLLDQRYVIGDDTELVDKENAKQVKIEALVSELNAAITALNAFSTELGVDAVLQARLIGNLTFKTLSGLTAYGEPPNVGTPSEPLAFVYDDEASSGLYRWVATSGAWEQQVPWVKGDKGDKGETGNTGADGASAFALAQTDGFDGTLSQWIASLKGDKGDQGDPGLTSYQHAVDEGFVGDLTAWLASLKGDKGDKGDGIGTQIDGDTTALLHQQSSGEPGSISAREIITDPSTGETWIGKNFGMAKLALYDDLMGAAGVSTMSMLEKVTDADWWLAPQDAATTWLNRGTGPASAQLDAGATFSSDVDFSPITVTDGSGVTLADQPVSATSTETWTIAWMMNYTDTENGTGNSSVFSCVNSSQGLFAVVRSNGTVQFYFRNPSASTSSYIVTFDVSGKDCLFILGWDGPNSEAYIRIISRDSEVYQEVNPGAVGDCPPGIDFEFARSDSRMNGELGDIVIDAENIWSMAEGNAAYLALSMRYQSEQSIYRRLFEQGRIGVTQAGDGLEEISGTFEVKPDTATGWPNLPVDVSSDGVSVDANEINGFGGGAPVDRTTGSPTFGSTDFGEYFEIDTAPTFQKGIPANVGYGIITIASTSNTDLTAIGATDVTFQGPNTVIPAYGTIVAKLVATDTYRLIGAVEP